MAGGSARAFLAFPLTGSFLEVYVINIIQDVFYCIWNKCRKKSNLFSSEPCFRSMMSQEWRFPHQGSFAWAFVFYAMSLISLTSIGCRCGVADNFAHLHALPPEPDYASWLISICAIYIHIICFRSVFGLLFTCKWRKYLLFAQEIPRHGNAQQA